LKTDETANEHAKVLTCEVSICSFLLSDFEDLLVLNPTLALSYPEFVGLKMKRFKNSYSKLVFKDAKTRLYSFLKDWAEGEGIQEGNKYTLQNYLTPTAIAQIICTSRQTAALLLSEMQKEELITCDRKSISILNIDQLIV
jgi:CRP-like cAMP-binding protein